MFSAQEFQYYYYFDIRHGLYIIWCVPVKISDADSAFMNG